MFRNSALPALKGGREQAPRPRGNPSAGEIGDGKEHTPAGEWRAQLAERRGKPPPLWGSGFRLQAPPPSKWQWPWLSAWEGSSVELASRSWIIYEAQ